MAKILISQNQFNGGEWSPRLYSRSDQEGYSNALETATNCESLVHGPIRRRAGSKFIAEAKDATAEVHLIKFQFSRNDSYVLELGNNYIRFFTDSGQVIESSLTITGITAANPAVVTSTAHDLSDGDHIYITGVVGMTEINDNNIPYIVANKTANTFEVTDHDGTNVDSSAFTAYSSGGSINKIYEVVSPWSTSEVPDISYTQFGDILYITHPSYEPRKLTRTTSTSWAIATLNAKPPPTYQGGTADNTTVTPGATTGNGVTFTAGSGVFITGDIGRQIVNSSTGETGIAIITAVGSSPSTTATCDIVEDFTDTNAIASGDWSLDLSPIAALTPDGTSVGSIVTIDADLPGTSTTSSDTFRATDVGKYIVIHGGVVQITQRISGNQIKGEVLKTLDSDDETGNWTLEEPSWSASRGYPRSVGLFEERLVFGGTAEEPQTLWMSETGIFDGFGGGSADADAITVTLGSTQVNQINWLAASRDLILGTAGGEITVNSGGSAGAITPTNISQQPRTSYGSSIQQPIVVGNEVLFLQESGRKVRTFLYDFNIDSYTGKDLTELAEHITEGGVKEIAYSQEPDTRIFAVTNNGGMLCGTYKRDQQVIGWSSFTTDGTYENVQTVSQGAEDQVWTVAKRTINGTNRRYIELMVDQDGTDDTSAYSDCHLTLTDNLAITSITAANPAVVTSASHGLSDGDVVVIKDLVDPEASALDSTKTNMSSLNQCVFTVANKATNTFELTTSGGSNIDASAYNAYGSGGNAFLKVTSVTGLDHLEAKLVQIKVDGALHDPKTVASGAITLDAPAGEVVIGLPYTTTIKTLSAEYDVGIGSMQGQRTRHARPLLRVFESTRPLLNGEYLPSRKVADNMDKKVTLTSGFLEYGPLMWDSTGQLTITVSTPFPLLLTGVTGAIDSGSP